MVGAYPGYGVVTRAREENANAVTLAERELTIVWQALGHGIWTSLTRATVVRLAT